MAKQKLKKDDRQTIDNETLILELKKLFQTDTTDKGKCKELLGIKFKLQAQRYYRVYKQAYNEWVNLAVKASDKSIVGSLQDMLNRGLKTKTDSALEIQKDIEELYKQLRGDVHFTFIVGNKTFNSHNKDGAFVLPMEKKNDILKTIRELKVELNKMVGYHSPNKFEQISEDIVIELI